MICMALRLTVKSSLLIRLQRKRVNALLSKVLAFAQKSFVLDIKTHEPLIKTTPIAAICLGTSN